MSSVTPVAGRQRPTESDHRWLVLVIVAVAQLMVVLDATVVNIALPSAQHALGFPNSDRQGVVTAYALAFGSLLLVGGRLGDMFSRKGSSSPAWPGSRSPRRSAAPPPRSACWGLPGRCRAPSAPFPPPPPWAPWSAPSATRVSAAGRSASSVRRGWRRCRGPDPRRRPHTVLLLALGPVRQPVLRRDRRDRRPGLHAEQPAGARPRMDWGEPCSPRPGCS